MKFELLVFLYCQLMILMSVLGQESNQMELVWSDEFDVDGKPNSQYWGYERGFVRNEELQWYQEDNVWVEDGKLIIEGREERLRNLNYSADSESWKTNREFAEYTSASINTKGKKSWKYGRFEIRAKIVAEDGLWPAAWTLGAEGSWPSCGEIDIMEYYQGRILANFAWGSLAKWTPIWKTESIAIDDKFDDDFHIWVLDWDKEFLKIFLDGQLLNQVEIDKTVNQDNKVNPFHLPQYILLNLAIGGNRGGDPKHSEFPTRYEIDYVRVYQKKISL